MELTHLVYQNPKCESRFTSESNRSLFAKQKIEAGSILFIEHGFSVKHSSKMTMNMALMGNKYAWDKLWPRDILWSDDFYPDVLEENVKLAQRKINANIFSMEKHNILTTEISTINHSKYPNAKTVCKKLLFDGDHHILIVITITNIDTDEEIFIKYNDNISFNEEEKKEIEYSPIQFHPEEINKILNEYISTDKFREMMIYHSMINKGAIIGGKTIFLPSFGEINERRVRDMVYDIDHRIKNTNFDLEMESFKLTNLVFKSPKCKIYHNKETDSRSLIATSDINPGDILMIEHCFSIKKEDAKNIVITVANNESMWNTLWPRDIEWSPNFLPDVTDEVHNLACRKFRANIWEDKKCYSMAEYMSCVNHSKYPNSDIISRIIEFDGNQYEIKIMVATRKINSGDEVKWKYNNTISFGEEEEPADYHQLPKSEYPIKSIDKLIEQYIVKESFRNLVLCHEIINRGAILGHKTIITPMFKEKRTEENIRKMITEIKQKIDRAVFESVIYFNIDTIANDFKVEKPEDLHVI